MSEYILSDVKKFVGLDPSDTDFDLDILIDIGSALSVVEQSAADVNFVQATESAKWSDLTNSEKLLSYIREYVCLRVRLIFDPPSSSVVVDAYKNRISELEWRFNVQSEKDSINQQ